MSRYDKLVAALTRLYRAVLNRSQHVYPIYARQVAALSAGHYTIFISIAKREAIRIVTAERKRKAA